LIGVCLFVVSLQDYAKTTQPIFTKFGGKAAYGSVKKLFDFGGNPDHVMLGLGWGSYHCNILQD